MCTCVADNKTEDPGDYVSFMTKLGTLTPAKQHDDSIGHETKHLGSEQHDDSIGHETKQQGSEQHDDSIGHETKQQGPESSKNTYDNAATDENDAGTLVNHADESRGQHNNNRSVDTDKADEPTLQDHEISVLVPIAGQEAMGETETKYIVEQNDAIPETPAFNNQNIGDIGSTGDGSLMETTANQRGQQATFHNDHLQHMHRTCTPRLPSCLIVGKLN